MYFNQHIGHMLWLAEERRDDLLREAKRFRLMKQQHALQHLSKYRTNRPFNSRLRQKLGGFFIALGQRLQGHPQPNFSVN